MKQRDIALIIVIAAVSGLVSFFVSHLIFAAPANRQQKVEVVDKITTEFQNPDRQYFNVDSVDPTQKVPVGTSDNNNPFIGSTH